MENDADVVALLESWFQFAAEDALVIDPGCITAEARGNLCAFSPPPDTSLDVAPVVAFVHRVAAYRAAQVAGHAMTLYCWHDATVRQLRLSLVSSQHIRLPPRGNDGCPQHCAGHRGRRLEQSSIPVS